MTTTLRLSQSILLAIGLGLCLVRRSVWLWPIVVWNMYDVAQYSLPPAHASALEVHVIGSAGEQAVLEPTALLSMEYAGAAERLVDGAFASDDSPLRRAYQLYLARLVRDLSRGARIARIEGWRLTWRVNPRSVPPLSREQPIEQVLVGSFTPP